MQVGVVLRAENCTNIGAMALGSVQKFLQNANFQKVSWRCYKEVTVILDDVVCGAVSQTDVSIVDSSLTDINIFCPLYWHIPSSLQVFKTASSATFRNKRWSSSIVPMGHGAVWIDELSACSVRCTAWPRVKRARARERICRRHRRTAGHAVVQARRPQSSRSTLHTGFLE